MGGNGAATAAAATGGAGKLPSPSQVPVMTQTQSSGGLGKWYAAAQGLESLTSIMGGFFGNQSAGLEAKAEHNQADLLRTQADQLQQEAQYQAQIAIEESRFSAMQKARDVTTTRSQQGMEYAHSGVLLTGSPALVLERTRQLGQQEVDALVRQGKAQADFINLQANNQANVARQQADITDQKANIVKNNGRAGLIGSIFGAATNTLGAYVLGQKTNTPTTPAKVLPPTRPKVSPLGPVYSPNGPLSPLDPYGDVNR